LEESGRKRDERREKVEIVREKGRKKRGEKGRR